MDERTTDVLSYIQFNMWTVRSDVSIQRRHWQPLSVHLWAYCTHPSHDVNDVMYEGRLQQRGLRPLLFSNSGVGSFTSHKNQITVSDVRWDYGFSTLSEKTRKSNHWQMSLQRQHFLLSYLKTPIVGQAGVRTRDLPFTRPFSPTWAMQPSDSFVLFWSHFIKYHSWISAVNRRAICMRTRASAERQ